MVLVVWGWRSGKESWSGELMNSKLKEARWLLG